MRVIEMVTGPNRTQTAARLTRFMEANHDARIRTQVSRARSAMESSVIAAMSRLGAHDPIVGSQAVMACAEGVILHRIARHDNTDPRPILALVISAAPPSPTPRTLSSAMHPLERVQTLRKGARSPGRTPRQEQARHRALRHPDRPVRRSPPDLSMRPGGVRADAAGAKNA